MAGFIPQNILVAGGDNHVFVAFAGKYGAPDFNGPRIENVDLSDFRRNRPWIVTAELNDVNGVIYSDINFRVEGQENFDYLEPDSSATDESGNGLYFYHIPSDVINDQRLAAGDSVFFFILAQDALGNGSESEMNTIIVDEGWIPADPGEPELQHFTDFLETDASHFVVITSISLSDEPAQTGWEAGVFTQNGLLAGAGIWVEGDELDIAAWGDDVATDVIDGFQDGEDMAFRFWDNDADEEYYAATDIAEGSIRWQTDARTVLSLFAFREEQYPPEWTEVPEAINADEGAMIQFSVMADDRNNDAITILIDRGGLPGAANFTDNGDGTGEFVWQTDFDDAGEYRIILFVSDGDMTADAPIQITVNNVNRAPVFARLGSPPDNWNWEWNFRPELHFDWSKSSDSDSDRVTYRLNFEAHDDVGDTSVFFDVGNDTAIILDLREVYRHLGFNEGGYPREYLWSVWSSDGTDSVRSEETRSIGISLNAKGDPLHPLSLILSAFPNPFNSTTTITFSVQQASPPVRLSIYNLQGCLVKELVNGTLEAGEHKVVWDASGLATGIYLLRLETNRSIQTSKALLIR